VARYRAAGFTVEPAWHWMQMSIQPRLAWAFHRRGIDPENAAAFILSGVTPAQAASLERTRPDTLRSRPHFSGHARVAWTSGELRRLSAAELRQVLTQDLRVRPSGDSAAILQAQVLGEQGRQAQRGTVHWIALGVDEVILYERSAAQQAGRFITAQDAVKCWGDLERLVRSGEAAGQEILDYLWDEWCGGLSPEDLGLRDAGHPRWTRVASGRDLLALVPPDTTLHVSNRTADGGFRFIDPFDPMQLGVPRLAVDRYGVERWEVVAYRKVMLERHLPYIRSTLDALGWRLRQGSERDLDALSRGGRPSGQRTQR
jgi:hypothetical protein